MDHDKRPTHDRPLLLCSAREWKKHTPDGNTHCKIALQDVLSLLFSPSYRHRHRAFYRIIRMIRVSRFDIDYVCFRRGFESHPSPLVEFPRTFEAEWPPPPPAPEALLELSLLAPYIIPCTGDRHLVLHPTRSPRLALAQQGDERRKDRTISFETQDSRLDARNAARLQKFGRGFDWLAC